MSRHRSDKLRQRVGIALMAGSLGVAGSVLSLAPAGAQADAEPVPVEVEKTAHFVYNSGSATPDTVTSEFPPGVMCVVEPRLCPEDAAPVFDAVGGAAGTAEEAPEEPASTVEPGTLPVEIFSGVDKMVSAVKFTLPPLEPGAEMGRFVLHMKQVQPSYHSSSPMFRQAVLAAVAFAGSRDPGTLQEEFTKAAQSDPVETSQYLGVEACPTTEDFKAAGRQGTEAQPEAAIPSVDCLYGANGVKLEGTDIWEFDLTFAAEAWYAGDLENNGILLRSTGAPNLAFGDPDSSTHSRVTFDPAVATAAVEQQPAPEQSTFTPPSSGTTSGTSSPGFSAPSSSGNIFAPPASFAPEVADGGDPAPEVAQDQGVQQQPVAVPFLEGGDPLTPWWIWLLVPIFLAGMYLTAQTLTTEVVLAAERDGAMMRLIEQRRGGSLSGASGAPTGPRQGALSRLTGGK